MSADRDQELSRIRAEYDRRAREIPSDFYAKDRPANLFLRHGQERVLVQLLGDHHVTPLAGKRLLDIGCGEGEWLSIFERMGVRRADLAGIDLDPDRAAECRARVPGADVRAGDASRLPWPDASFDLVSQLTVFTSILDAGLKRAIAAEMRRVLRPGGRIVWYDFSYDNPRNRNVRGIGRREIAALFPGCRLDLRRATLAPPLARRLVPRSWTAAALLESMRILNTHWLGLIEPTP
jgi:ubiquinone/menaquinone biosynthesis C-methylase UbiE